MIHHISIAVANPQQVAQGLAELWSSEAVPFPPHPGSYMVIAYDEYGTLIEVYPQGTELVPGTQEHEVSFAHNPRPSRYTATHAAISVPASQSQIEQLAAREGWRAVRCDREGLFEVIELWVENTVMLELLPAELAAKYLAFSQPENLKRLLAEMLAGV